MTKSKPVN